MRRTVCLLLTLALGGCALDLPGMNAGGLRGAVPKPTRVSTRSEEHTPTPTPTPAPTATATATPAPVATAQIVPPGPVRTLTGVIRIDPSYIIAAGGGNLIGQAGGNIIAAGGGNLIGQAGGNYRLFQAGAEAMLPVQGMTVEVISLLTGERLAGPVQTDENGTYQLEVREAEAINLLVRAFPPAAKADPRLQYGLMVQPGASEASVIDEDTSLMTKLVVECLAIRLEEHFVKPVEESLTFYPTTSHEKVRPTIEILHGLGQKANVAALDDEKRKVVLQRAARVLLGYSDLAKAKNTLVDQPALESLVEVFAEIRLGSKDKLVTEPQFSEASQNPTGREILKVTDLGDYIVDLFKTSKTQGELITEAGQTLASIGVQDTASWKLFGAYLGITNENQRTLEENSEAVEAILRVLKAGAAE